jgi:hypothetical protein
MRSPEAVEDLLNEAWPIRKRRLSASPAKPSVMEHKKAESEHKDTGSISFYETRGVRDASNTYIFADLDETFSSGNYSGFEEAQMHASLLEVAHEWLREFGEEDIIAVAQEADGLHKSARKKKLKEGRDRSTFQRWFETGMEHGFLSPAAIAANFVMASALVHRLSQGDEQLKLAIFRFAQSWHWMHFECQGEHELAAIGWKSAQGRARGPIVKQQRAEMKRKLIADLFKTFVSDQKNAARGMSPKKVAGALFKKVNELLAELDLDGIAEKTLTDEVRLLLRRDPRLDDDDV